MILHWMLKFYLSYFIYSVLITIFILFYLFQKKKEDELDGKRKKEGMNLVIPFVPSADNSNLSADGDDSFVSVDSAMPSPFSEVGLCFFKPYAISVVILHLVEFLLFSWYRVQICGYVGCLNDEPWKKK